MSEIMAAEEMLLNLLGDHIPKNATYITDELKAEGLKRKDYTPAKINLGIVSFGLSGGRTYWWIPPKVKNG